MQNKKKVLPQGYSKGTIFELEGKKRYLVILPKNAEIKLLGEELGRFFYPCPVFCLAVNDVDDVKIAELIENS